MHSKREIVFETRGSKDPFSLHKKFYSKVEKQKRRSSPYKNTLYTFKFTFLTSMNGWKNVRE